MGSREPKHLSCPTHGAVWGTIYADGAVDYDCGCHATPTPPAPAVCECCGKTDCSCWSDPRCGAEKKIPPAPADDATRHESASAEAMRADFLAWVNAGYLVRDAVTDVEWDDEGLPLYYTRNDGVRHYLDGEWHAWQAARALPLPARREEAVVEAARAAVVRFAVEARNHGTFPVNECGVIDQTSAVYQSYIATLADLWRSVDALTAALRGTRPEGHSPASGQGGDK